MLLHVKQITKAGMILSADNENKLLEAHGLINGVLSKLEKLDPVEEDAGKEIVVYEFEGQVYHVDKDLLAECKEARLEELEELEMKATGKLPG